MGYSPCLKIGYGILLNDGYRNGEWTGRLGELLASSWDYDQDNTWLIEAGVECEIVGFGYEHYGRAIIATGSLVTKYEWCAPLGDLCDTTVRTEIKNQWRAEIATAVRELGWANAGLPLSDWIVMSQWF